MVMRPLVWVLQVFREASSTRIGEWRRRCTVRQHHSGGDSAVSGAGDRGCVVVVVVPSCATVSWGGEGRSDGPGRGSGRAGTEPGHLVQDRPRQALLCCLTQSLGGPGARRTAPPLLLARPPPRRLQHSTWPCPRRLTHRCRGARGEHPLAGRVLCCGASSVTVVSKHSVVPRVCAEGASEGTDLPASGGSPERGHRLPPASATLTAQPARGALCFLLEHLMDSWWDVSARWWVC